MKPAVAGDEVTCQIRFKTGLTRIFLESPLPAPTSQLTAIDGTNELGVGVRPHIDGFLAPATTNGDAFTVAVSGVTISNLSISNWPPGPGGANASIKLRRDPLPIRDIKIVANVIGLSSLDVSDCDTSPTARNAAFGIVVGPGARHLDR